MRANERIPQNSANLMLLKRLATSERASINIFTFFFGCLVIYRWSERYLEILDRYIYISVTVGGKIYTIAERVVFI